MTIKSGYAMVAFMSPPEQTSYCANKSAIEGFSESLWAELLGEAVFMTVPTIRGVTK